MKWICLKTSRQNCLLIGMRGRWTFSCLSSSTHTIHIWSNSHWKSKTFSFSRSASLTKIMFICDFFRNRQLNATLELDREHKILYRKKCFNNPEINDQGEMLDENHLIEKQVRYLLPGQLIIFGKLDNNNGQSRNRFVVKTSAMIRWSSHVENFIWNNLGKWKLISRRKNLSIALN